MLKFLIVDDHKLFSNGLKKILEKFFESNITLIHDPKEALALNFNNYNLAIIDMEMPNIKGLDLIQKIKNRGENTNFMVISMHNKPSLIKKAKKIGVQSYMLKDDDVEEIINAAHTVLKGEHFLSSKIDQSFLNNKNNTQIISPREEQVLRYISSGKTMKEIGELLNISPETAITHSKKIKIKLNINSKAGLIKYAYDNLLT